MKKQYVIGASVVAKLFFPEELSDQSKKLFQNALKSNWQLLAPKLVDYEFGNICWKRVKHGELKEIEAIEIIQNYQKINLNKIDIDNFIPNILALAINTQTTFYDCSYLILATELNTKFITADDSFAKQMQNYFPKQMVSLKTLDIIY